MRKNSKNSRTFVIIALALLFAITNVSYGADVDSQNKVDIRIGTQKALTVPEPKISRVDVADPSILSAKVSGDNRLVLTAIKKGITSVSIWQRETESLDYIVTTWNILPENIKEMIKDIPSATLMRTGSKITLMGALLTQKDEQRIKRITEVFSNDVDNLTYYDSQQSKYEALKHILQAIGHPNVKARFVSDNVVLSGTVYSKEDKERAEIAASAYVGEKGKVSNTIVVTDLPVEIDVVFVQLTPTSGSEIGADEENLGIFQGPSLEFNPKKTADAAAGTLRVGTIGYALLNQRLTYLESKGLAKTIDKPHISTISGKLGRVQYGGEIGIKTIGPTGAADVDYKDFGLILEVNPVVRPDNMITVEVKVEVSQPVAATSGADVQFQTFETSTHGSVKVGETLVLSGLKETVRERFKKNVPFVGNIPILNLLFAKEKKEIRQTDIAVLLTPHLPTIEKESVAGPAGSREAKGLYKTVTDPNMQF